MQGHIIKSGKTKITQAVKQIQANHRVILSGTPVQVGQQPFDLPFYYFVGSWAHVSSPIAAAAAAAA